MTRSGRPSINGAGWPAPLTRPTTADPSAAPTPAQLRVLALRAVGLSRREIVERLGISQETYYNHLGDAYIRLDIEPSSNVTGSGANCLHEAWRRLGWLRVPEDVLG